VHRLATFALSLGLLLGLSGAGQLLAQDEPKKDAAPQPEASKTEPAPAPSQPEAAKPKDETPKPDASASASTEATPPPIPPAVEAKLEAARRAVAEAIVAAQDAGLVNTSIEPPPILDILITGRANDAATLKARTGVSPEVFGAWFSGNGTVKEINPQKDVRIVPPDLGLKDLYTQRADILNRHIAAVRKASGGDKKDAAAEEKKEPTKEETKDEAAKKDNQGKKSAKDDAKEDDKKGDASKDGTPK
jgi:hypothetical protein